MAKKRKGVLVLLEWAAVILLGGLLGSALAALGQALLGDGPVMGALTKTWTIGVTPPFTLDLKVLSLTLGLTLDVGLLTLVGTIVAVWLYLRLR